MPYLQIEDKQYPLLEGDTRVGRGESADVQLPAGAAGDHVVAVITIAIDHSASVRRGSPGAAITVNSIQLAGEPALLFHGDRLEIDGHNVIYADEAHAGSTGQMSVSSIPTKQSTSAPPGQRARTNGRVVSLIDGREYTVGADGVSIGREAGCDIVIAVGEVSRRHARIELRSDGYVIVDLSTNGVLVNGSRIRGSHALSRGDTIRIGPEELRFHADANEVEATPPPPPVIIPPKPIASASPAPPPPSHAPAPPSGVGAAGSLTADAPSEVPRPPKPVKPPNQQVLATLEIMNEGPTKGTRFSVVSPLSHVGRGPHNDVVINDESVSDSHAKLQRRDSGWYVVDMDSTNGTYVGGKRVEGEEPLGPNVDLRFGGVKLFFKTAGSAREGGSGTRVIVGYRATPEVPPSAIPEDAEAPAGMGASGSDAGRVPWLLTVVVVLLAIAVVVLIVRS